MVKILGHSNQKVVKKIYDKENAKNRHTNASHPHSSIPRPQVRDTPLQGKKYPHKLALWSHQFVSSAIMKNIIFSFNY